MVRFIINGINAGIDGLKNIYIPIWLDLLLLDFVLLLNMLLYLHSNMVRFIIRKRYYRFWRIKEIYIPIWLDLLYETNELILD